MAAARSSKLSEPSHSRDDSASEAAVGAAPKQAGPPEAAQEVQPLLSHASIDNFSATAGAAQPAGAELPAAAGSGGAEQGLQQESAKGDAGDVDAGTAGRAMAEPLSWSTRIASKLFIKVPPALRSWSGHCQSMCMPPSHWPGNQCLLQGCLIQGCLIQAA